MLGITLRWTSNVNTPICAHSNLFQIYLIRRRQLFKDLRNLFNTTESDISSKGAGFWRFWSESKTYGIVFWKVFRKTEKRKFQNTNHSTKNALKSEVKTEHLLLVRNILKVEQSAQVSSFPEIVGNDIPITTGNFWRCKLEFLLKKRAPRVWTIWRDTDWQVLSWQQHAASKMFATILTVLNHFNFTATLWRNKIMCYLATHYITALPCIMSS